MCTGVRFWLTNQSGRCRRSLGFRASGACILIGCLLLGGLDKCRGLAAGWLHERCGRAHQIGGGGVYRSSRAHQHCGRRHSVTLRRQEKCDVPILMPHPTPSLFFFFTLLSPSWLSVCVVGITVAVGVGMGTVAGVTMGRMLARGVALLPGEGLGLLLGDGVLGVGRMLAVGGSLRLELVRRP